MKKDYSETDFWNTWLKADIIQREKILAPITKKILRINTVPKAYQEHTLLLLLNDYFSDLESTICINFQKKTKHLKGKK